MLSKNIVKPMRKKREKFALLLLNILKSGDNGNYATPPLEKYPEKYPIVRAQDSAQNSEMALCNNQIFMSKYVVPKAIG
jgi:hypothetical protein